MPPLFMILLVVFFLAGMGGCGEVVYDPATGEGSFERANEKVTKPVESEPR